MRIIHFSDVHAGRWLMHLGGYFDKRILGAINFCGINCHVLSYA